MAELRHYRTFYGVKPSDVSFTWGGTTYNTFLVDNYMDDEIQSEPSSKIYSYVSLTGCTFLYPHRIQRNYFIEGVMSGHIHVFNDGTANLGEKDVTQYDIELVKIDEGGTYTSLSSFTQVMTSGERGVATQDYKCFPYFLDITDRKEIGQNERIAIVCKVACASAALYLYHDNDRSNEDFKISLGMIL